MRAKLTVAPAKLADLRGFPYVEAQEAERQRVMEILKATPEADTILSDAARTMSVDGRVVGLFGIWPMWPGAGRAWTLLSHEVLRYPKTLHRVVKNELADFIAKHEMRRVEAIIVAGHLTGERWIRRLGFLHEGTLRKYNLQGEDCEMYARCQS